MLSLWNVAMSVCSASTITCGPFEGSGDMHSYQVSCRHSRLHLALDLKVSTLLIQLQTLLSAHIGLTYINLFVSWVICGLRNALSANKPWTQSYVYNTWKEFCQGKSHQEPSALVPYRLSKVLTITFKAASNLLLKMDSIQRKSKAYRLTHSIVCVPENKAKVQDHTFSFWQVRWIVCSSLCLMWTSVDAASLLLDSIWMADVILFTSSFKSTKQVKWSIVWQVLLAFFIESSLCKGLYRGDRQVMKF